MSQPEPRDYWKSNIYAVIDGDVEPRDIAAWDARTLAWYFPDDWKQYQEVEMEWIEGEWVEEQYKKGRQP